MKICLILIFVLGVVQLKSIRDILDKNLENIKNIYKEADPTILKESLYAAKDNEAKRNEEKLSYLFQNLNVPIGEEINPLDSFRAIKGFLEHASLQVSRKQIDEILQIVDLDQNKRLNKLELQLFLEEMNSLFFQMAEQGLELAQRKVYFNEEL